MEGPARDRGAPPGGGASAPAVSCWRRLSIGMQSSWGSENALPAPEPAPTHVPPWGADRARLQSPTWAAAHRLHFFLLGFLHLVPSSRWSGRGRKVPGVLREDRGLICVLRGGAWSMNLASQEVRAGKCSRAKTPPDRTMWPSAASPAPWASRPRKAVHAAPSKEPRRPADEAPA